MENPNILTTWKTWQIGKHGLQKVEKTFRRAIAVMGVWLEDATVQFLDPDKAWTTIVEKTSQKVLHDESLDRLDTPTKGLFKWAKEQRTKFEAVRNRVVQLEENFKSACKQAGLRPEKVMEELLHDWESTTSQWLQENEETK